MQRSVAIRPNATNEVMTNAVQTRPTMPDYLGLLIYHRSFRSSPVPCSMNIATLITRRDRFEVQRVYYRIAYHSHPCSSIAVSSAVGDDREVDHGNAFIVNMTMIVTIKQGLLQKKTPKLHRFANDPYHDAESEIEYYRMCGSC